MSKRISLNIFIVRLSELKNPPTILSFNNYSYQHTKLPCHCNNCNTNYTAIPKKILSTSIFGCPNCYRNMKIEQTKRMTDLAKLPNSVKKRLNTFKETNCCKQGSIKTKQTKLKRYGDENYCNSDRIKESKLAKYGNPTYNNREKSVETCLNKYGVEFTTQLDIPRYTNKTFTFPSGNNYSVQGYEPKALKILLEQGYTENQICIKNRPSIKYFWSSSDGFGDNKWHRYTPDIIIPKENRIIEVKSTWTFNGQPAVYSKNLAKQQACIDAGYKFEFWIL